MINLNTQPVEKQTLREDGLLEVHSIFPTIQGEGPLAGTPAVFIRLAGCNLQCKQCDTEYTSKRQMMSPEQILSEVRNLIGDRKRLLVLTGGEPFRQDFFDLAEDAMDLYPFQVETNGTLCLNIIPYHPYRFSIVCSPKTPTINKDLQRYITAYKYVIQEGMVDETDGLPLSVLGNPIRPARPHERFKGEVFIQPADEQDDARNLENTKAAIESSMKYGYRMSIQLHKFLNLE